MNDPYLGIPSLNAAYEKDPALGKAIVDRYRKLMESGANKARIQREAQILGYAPIVDVGDGSRQDMTDYLSQQAPRTWAEGVQDTTMGIGRGLASIVPDVVSLGGLAARQFGYEGLSEQAVKLREGINEFLPMSNEYRAARQAKHIFDLNPSAIGQAGGSILGMYAGGALLKGAGKLGAAARGAGKAAGAAEAAATGLSPAIKTGIAMGAGSAAEEAYQAGATPGQSILPALAGAAGGYLEKFGTERFVSQYFNKGMFKLEKDAMGKYLLPKASSMPGFFRTATPVLMGETLEEQVASGILEAGKTTYEDRPFLERLRQGQIDTLANAPYAIGPLAVSHGFKGAALKGRLAQAEKLFKNNKSIFRIDGIGSKPLDRLRVGKDQLDTADREVLDTFGAESGYGWDVTSASHEGLNEMARQVADSGIRVVFVSPSETVIEDTGDPEAPKVRRSVATAGKFNAANNTLYINSDAPPEAQAIFGLMHEVMHALKKADPKGMQGVFDRMASAFGPGFQEYADLIAEEYVKRGLIKADGTDALTEEGFVNFATQAMFGYTAAALTDEDTMRSLAFADPSLFSDISSVFGSWARTLVGKPGGKAFDKQLAEGVAFAVDRMNEAAGMQEQSMPGDPAKALANFALMSDVVESLQKMLGDRGARMEQVRRAVADVRSEKGAITQSFLMSELADRLGVSIPEAQQLYQQAQAGTLGKEEVSKLREYETSDIIGSRMAEAEAANAEMRKALGVEPQTEEERAAAAAEEQARAAELQAKEKAKSDLVYSVALANQLGSKYGFDPIALLADPKTEALSKNSPLDNAEQQGLLRARDIWKTKLAAAEAQQEESPARKEIINAAQLLEGFDRTKLDQKLLEQERLRNRTPQEVVEDTRRQEAQRQAEEAKRQAEAKRKADEAKAAQEEAKRKAKEAADQAAAKKTQEREAAKKTKQGQEKIDKAKRAYDRANEEYAQGKRRVQAAETTGNAELPKLQAKLDSLAAKVRSAAQEYEGLTGTKLAVPEGKGVTPPAPAEETQPPEPEEATPEMRRSAEAAQGAQPQADLAAALRRLAAMSKQELDMVIAAMPAEEVQFLQGLSHDQRVKELNKRADAADKKATDAGDRFAVYVPLGKSRTFFRAKSKAVQPIFSLVNKAFEGSVSYASKKPTIASPFAGGRVRTIAKMFLGKLGPDGVFNWKNGWNGKWDAESYDARLDEAATRMMDVVRAAVHEFPNWETWYRDRIDMAMRIFAELDPEMAKPENEFIFKSMLAVTSNGEKVEQQTNYSWQMYLAYKRTRSFVKALDALRGEDISLNRLKAMRGSFELLDELIAGHGWEKVASFMNRSGLNSELRKDLQKEFGFTAQEATKLTDEELVDEVVPYSLFFGAKIGSFYNNLRGNFDTTTMDRWFMRTWGRMMGTQVTTKDTGPYKDRLEKAMAALRNVDPDAIRVVDEWTELPDDASIEEKAAQYSKYFGGKERREGFMGGGNFAERDEFRLAANRLAMFGDGYELHDDPKTGSNRRHIRRTMAEVLRRMEKKYGWTSTPAELQALLWYYEKELHEEFGSGETENPDYGSAANAVWRKATKQPDFGGQDAASYRPAGLESRRSRARAGKGPSGPPTGGATQEGAAAQQRASESKNALAVKITPQQDAKYKALVEGGNMAAAKRMVMDAMRAANWVVNALPGMVKKDQTFYHGTALGRFIDLHPKLKAAAEKLQERQDAAYESVRQYDTAIRDMQSDLDELRYWWNKADRRAFEGIPREIRELGPEGNYLFNRSKLNALESERKEMRRLRSALGQEIQRIERETGEGPEKANLPDRYTAARKEITRLEDERLRVKQLRNLSAPAGVEAFSRKMIGRSTDAGYYGPGFYFTQDKEYAALYSTSSSIRLPEGVKKSPFVYEVAIKMDKPYYMGYPDMEDKNDVTIPGMFGGSEVAMDQSSYRQLEEAGYDGIIVQESASSRTREFVVWDPAKVKSVEAATYDNEGNLIPLSQRFNPATEDLRYAAAVPLPAKFIADKTRYTATAWTAIKFRLKEIREEYYEEDLSDFLVEGDLTKDDFDELVSLLTQKVDEKTALPLEIDPKFFSLILGEEETIGRLLEGRDKTAFNKIIATIQAAKDGKQTPLQARAKVPAVHGTFAKSFQNDVAKGKRQPTVRGVLEKVVSLFKDGDASYEEMNKNIRAQGLVEGEGYDYQNSTALAKAFLKANSPWLDQKASFVKGVRAKSWSNWVTEEGGIVLDPDRARDSVTVMHEISHQVTQRSVSDLVHSIHAPDHSGSDSREGVGYLGRPEGRGYYDGLKFWLDNPKNWGRGRMLRTSDPKQFSGHVRLVNAYLSAVDAYRPLFTEANKQFDGVTGTIISPVDFLDLTGGDPDRVYKHRTPPIRVASQNSGLEFAVNSQHFSYYLSNMDEFIAGAHSDVGFQKWLNTIEASEIKEEIANEINEDINQRKSVWQMFIDGIQSLFGREVKDRSALQYVIVGAALIQDAEAAARAASPASLDLFGNPIVSPSPTMSAVAVKVPWFSSGIDKSDPLNFSTMDDPTTGWFIKQFVDYMQPVRAAAKSIERIWRESGGKLAQFDESMDVSAKLDMYRNLTANYMRDGQAYIDTMSAAMAEGNIPVSRSEGDRVKNANVSVDEYLVAKHAPRRNAVLLQDTLNKDAQYSAARDAGDMAAADARKAELIKRNADRRKTQIANKVTVEADITALSGMSDADSAKILSRAKHPAYGRISDANRLIQRRKIQIGLMSGLLSKEQADAWQRKYGSDYVPLKTTILDPNEQFLGGSGFNVRGSESRKARGRSSMADNIAGHTVVDYSAMVSRGMKNMVGQAWYNLAKANPNESWTLYDKSEDIPVERQSRIFSVKFAGDEKLMTINNAEMVRAMKNMDMADMGRGLAVASMLSRTFTKLQTAWSPAFIGPNFIRDLGLALTITSVDDSVGAAVRVAKNIPGAVRTIFAEQFNRAAGPFDREYREMQNQGALVGYSQYYSVTDAAAALQLQAEKMAKGESMPVKYLKGLADFMEKLNAVFERATRLAVYKEARERGLSQLKAAEVAANITVNFSRRGNATPVMNTLYPFFNASIQGTSNLSKRMFWSESATPRQKKRMALAVAGMSMMGYALSAIARGMGGDDDEGEEAYKNVPEYDLTRNLIVMKPDGSGDRYMLPLPWGLSLAHYVGVQTERMLAGDEDAATSSGRVLRATIENLSPINGATWSQAIAPTLVDPIVQVAENTNFAGAKIMPDRNPYDKTPVPDSQLKFKTVNPVASWAAETMNDLTGGSARKAGMVDVSPETIEHLSKFVGGGAGNFMYGIFSGVAKSVSGESMGIEELPAVGAVAGRFVTEEDPARKTKTEFFDNMRAFAMLREDLEDPETRSAARRDPRRRLESYTKTVDSQLRDLRKRQQAAKTDAAAKMLDDRMVVIMRRYNQRYNRLAQQSQ